MKDLKDAGHLLRLAGAFVAIFVIFLIVRSAFVPKGFGKYGHYRAEAIAEAMDKPLNYAGHAACETCHPDIVEVKTKGKHKTVNCESCHGPLEKHVDDPGSVVPAKLETPSLCPRCHTANAAKPKGFPQVHPEEHSSGLPCDTCHKPHTPVIEAQTAEAKK